MSDADSARPSPRRGRNASSDGSLRAARAAARARSWRSASSSSSSSDERRQHLALQRRERGAEALVDRPERVGDGLPVGPLDQRRELDELEVARDRVRDVEVGVQAQLAEPLADAGDVGQQLVAQRLERRVQRLLGPEQLLLEHLPLGADGGARLLGEGRRRLRDAARRARRVGEHEPARRARHRDVHQAPHRRDVRGAVVGAERLLEQRVGDRLARPQARAGHPRRCQPEHEDPVQIAARGRVERHQLHGAVGRRGVGAVLVAQAGVGDGGGIAREVARRRVRSALRIGACELAQAGEVDEPLDDVGLGREDLLAAQPETVDEAVHEEVRAGAVERLGRIAVHAQERVDVLARLGRKLRRLRRRAQRRDHVELAPARDLHAARDVDRAQRDGWARERAHRGAGIVRVGEQAQPGEHVANLGLREEVGLADRAQRDRALLEGERDLAALVARRAHDDADPPRRAAGVHEPLDLRRDRLRLRALVGGAPEAHDPAGLAAAAACRSGRRSARRPRAPRRAPAAGSAATARGGRSRRPDGRARSRARSSSPRARIRRAAPSSSAQTVSCSCSVPSSSTSSAEPKPRSAYSSTSRWP